MSPQDYMLIDGALLIIFALNCWVLTSEDPILQPLIPRAVVGITGFVFFSHALWMFADWIPSAAGPPFWRAMGDGCLVAASSTRLMQVFRAKWREKRRLAGLATMRNANLDVTMRLNPERAARLNG